MAENRVAPISVVPFFLGRAWLWPNDPIGPVGSAAGMSRGGWMEEMPGEALTKKDAHTPLKINIWNLKITENWKPEKSSDPNLHDFGFQPLIFHSVVLCKGSIFFYKCWMLRCSGGCFRSLSGHPGSIQVHPKSIDLSRSSPKEGKNGRWSLHCKYVLAVRQQ